ncbi:unnamed protein product [Prunus armeniaca]
MPSVNLPDFHDYISNLGAEECKDKCLGCLVWSKDLIDIQEFASGGNDLFIRLAHAELGNVKVTPKDSEMADMIETSRDALLHEYIRKHGPSEFVIYDFDSILIATSNFSITNKLGEGGFGPVYRGKLQEGKEIAVKRLSGSSVQGIEEFKNEMLLISKLQNKNLVRLMG